MSSWHVYALLTVVLWGTTPLIDKVALRTVAADTGLCVRAFTAAVILAIYALARGKFGEIVHGDTKGVLCFVVSAVLVSVAAQWTYFAALQRTEVSRLVPFYGHVPVGGCHPRHAAAARGVHGDQACRRGTDRRRLAAARREVMKAVVSG